MRSKRALPRVLFAVLIGVARLRGVSVGAESAAGEDAADGAADAVIDSATALERADGAAVAIAPSADMAAGTAAT